MGPTCQFDNINVPCFLSCSEDGSITSHLLAEMLKWMDDLSLFPIGGPLNLAAASTFISWNTSSMMTTNGKHVLALPMKKNKWQVGDSPRQNGNFNMEIGRGKMELI
jgi:hypothetical protein